MEIGNNSENKIRKNQIIRTKADKGKTLLTLTKGEYKKKELYTG
jgi:hypothetical protein